MSKVTIHTIAKELNLNSSTVSRALNNSNRVKKETKELILAKAKELGYQPNYVAANLRKKKSRSIGVVVPWISRHFFSTAIAGMEEASYEAGYSLIICQSLEDYERERQNLETLLANQVAGIVISVSMETSCLKHLMAVQNQEVPLVLFDRAVKDIQASHVLTNDFKAAYQTTTHLIEQGCQNIALLSGPLGVTIYEERVRGYKEALKDHGIKPKDELTFVSRLLEEDGYIGMKQLYQELPAVDGVFAANDLAAIGAMKYLKESNIAIPQTVRVAGFSNEPVSAMLSPSLTTVKQPAFEMGKQAVELLLKQIELSSDTESRILDSELIIRSSSR